MVALRSRRLERLFGARLEHVSYAQIAGLVASSTEEAYDLDFKVGIYGKSDKDKRDLAGDVGAMANTAGGVIVLGIEEDAQARAVGAPGVALSDAEVGRMHQIVAALVSPLPRYDIRQVEDEQQPGHGFILIAAPRSPVAPHAVLVNESLRFPRRNGATTAYLSEPEVANAYRHRFAGMQDRFDELARYQRDLVARLDVSEQTYVVVTLVPDLPGGFSIDMKAKQEFERLIINRDPLLFGSGLFWSRVSVGSRRLVADGSHDGNMSAWLRCELHQGGAGSFAAAVDRRRDGASESQVHEEAVINVIWSGLRFLAHHARDRAAAGGNVSVRAAIWPVSSDLPAQLMHTRFHGIPERLGSYMPTSPPESVGVYDIDDLAEDGPPLVAATYDLATGLFQGFGFPEALLLTSDGAIRIKYWRGNREKLRAWASTAGVQISDETLG